MRFGLFGHTHDDTIAVTKSVSDNKNIGVNLIAGSLTSYTNMNPSFLVIEIDEETMLPINSQTYYFNISHANIYNEPLWLPLHDLTTYYSMEDLSPDSINDFAHRVLNNQTLANLYEWNIGRQYGPMPTSCDDNCRLNKYCQITSTELFQNKECKGRPDYDWLEDPENALVNMLVNTWIKKDDAQPHWWPNTPPK